MEQNSSSLPVVDDSFEAGSRLIGSELKRTTGATSQVDEQVVETMKRMNGQVRRINQSKTKSGVDSNWTVR